MNAFVTDPVMSFINICGPALVLVKGFCADGMSNLFASPVVRMAEMFIVVPPDVCHKRSSVAEALRTFTRLVLPD